MQWSDDDLAGKRRPPRAILLGQHQRSVRQEPDGPRVVVYNALPWARSGVVEIPGQPGRLLFAADVPAGGYRTYPVERAETANPVLQDPPATLDTPFFKVRFDLKRGGVASLVEKRTGREWVDQASPYALGQFLHERFDEQQMLAFHQAYGRPGYSWQKGSLPKDVKRAALTPPAWTIALQRSGLADVATLTAMDTLGLARGVTLVFTLFRHQPCVEVEWRVTDKTPDPLPEGGWLCFPCAVAQPEFQLGRLGGPTNPARDILPGANRHYFCLNSGLTITGADGAGLGLCPLDSPCVSLDEPGLWKFSLDYTPKKIRQMDSSFDDKKFQDVCRDHFFKIQGAWTNRDLSGIRNLLTEEMSRIIQDDVEKLKSERKINKLENIAVRSVDIVDAWQESGKDYITVKFYANLLDYTTDETTGQVVSGSKTEPVKFEEYWTFTQPVGNKSWQLSALQQVE